VTENTFKIKALLTDT